MINHNDKLEQDDVRKKLLEAERFLNFLYRDLVYNKKLSGDHKVLFHGIMNIITGLLAASNNSKSINMHTLKIDEDQARRLYPSANGEFKDILEKEFGKDFLNHKITDRVKTFEDILAISGRTMEDLVNPNDTPDEIAYKQAKLIAEVYNEGEVLDAGNTEQYKYYPWHEIAIDPSHSSGFGLSYYDCAYWFSSSFVGVRLCFKSSELAVDAGKKFIKIDEELNIR